jgi:sugar phosphate permease
MGFLDTFGALGQTVLTFVIGVVAQTVGLATGFAVASGIILTGGLVSFAVLRTVEKAR